MSNRPGFQGAVRAGRDGEVQQLVAEELPRRKVKVVTAGKKLQHAEQQQRGQQQEEQQRHTTPVRNGHVTFLNGNDCERSRQSQMEDLMNASPQKLRVMRNSNWPLSMGGKIHTAPDDTKERGKTAKAGLPPKHLFSGGALNNSCVGRKNGAYALFARGGARRLARQSHSSRPTTDRVSTPCNMPKMEGSQRQTEVASAVTGSVSPDRVQSNVPGNEYYLSDGGEVAVANSLIGTKNGSSLQGVSRRIVHQVDPITRDAEQGELCKKGKGSKNALHCGRLIAPSDPFWNYEREHRRFIFNGMDEMGPAAAIPLLLKEAPSLPTVLEVAIADHFLASLMAWSQSEMERIVVIFAPHNRQEVLQYLRQTYDGHHSAAPTPSASNQGKQRQSPQREECLSTQRRHLSSTVRCLTYNNGTPSELSGTVLPPPKGVRVFLKSFTQEVCMAFMDEACAVCAGRCAQALSDQPEELRTRGKAMPGNLVDSLYEKSVTQLLSQMLAWTEKESSRVLSSVVRQVKQHVPPYIRPSPARED